MGTVSDDPQATSSSRTQVRRRRLTRFDIRCDCGERLEGKRRRKEQTLACPRCGGPVFVLPADRVPLRRRHRAPWARRTWRRVRRRIVRGVANWVGKARTRRAVPVRPKARLVTPVRVVAVGVGLILIGTVWVQWRRARQVALVDTVREHLDQAEASLRRTEIAEAHAHFRRVLDALDRLATPYPGADAIRRRAREVAIVAELCPECLETALATCVATSDPGATFADHYRGTTVVVACQARPVEPGPLEDDAFMLDYRVVLPDHEAVVVRVGQPPGAAWAKLRQARIVVLGARLDRLEVSERGKQLWLDPSSLLLVTDPRLLAARGWQLDASTAAVVAAQRTRQEEQP